jgi:hypothetical protein
MDYSLHSYPRELARQITAQWKAAGALEQLTREPRATRSQPEPSRSTTSRRIASQVTQDEMAAVIRQRRTPGLVVAYVPR